jgi:putative DNA-invertase from lambdoid prophage Rac
MRTAFLYVRISTDKQARSEYGIEAQEKACRAEAQKRGIQDVRLMLEGKMLKDNTLGGMSGSVPIADRPTLKVIRDQAKKGDVVIVSHRSRMGRDPAIMQELEAILTKKGVLFVSCAGEGTDKPIDDPGAELHRGIIDVVNRHERGVGRERTKKALAAQRERGERSAGCQTPFGWRLKPDGIHVMSKDSGVRRCFTRKPDCTGCRNIEQNPEEQAVIAIAQSKYGELGSLHRLAKWLDDNGHTKRSGRPWFHTEVGRILRRNKKPSP